MRIRESMALEQHQRDIDPRERTRNEDGPGLDT